MQGRSCQLRCASCFVLSLSFSLSFFFSFSFFLSFSLFLSLSLSLSLSLFLSLSLLLWLWLEGLTGTSNSQLHCECDVSWPFSTTGQQRCLTCSCEED